MNQVEILYTPREFYGGAISVALPESFKDISSHMMVPDHQEVHTDVDRDSQLIVEILEPEEINDTDALSYYFNDLAESNEATEPQIVYTRELKPEETPNIVDDGIKKFILFGYQKIIPGKKPDGQRELVGLFMCLLRLKSRSSDFLITLNQPFKNLGDSQTLAQESEQIFGNIVKSFTFVDLSKLFGN